MRRALVITLFCLIVLTFATVAQAQATRTWVSGVGDDANPCSRTAPCKTYAGAISKTATGGIISTLDPGGFGAVTITKSITIDGSEQIAGILAAGTSGVIINPGTAGVVVLRNLEIHGVGSGIDGIRVFSAAEVYVENCRIQNFTSDGIEILPGTAASTTRVTVRNTDIRNNTQQGIRVAPTNATALVKLDVLESNVSGNSIAGVLVGGVNNTAAFLNSSFDHNGIGVQVEQTSATVFAQGCSFSYNGSGIISGIAALTPVTRISGCMVVGNTTNGISGTGTVVGLTNNMIFGNAAGNTVSSSVVGQ
jgi:hypothetical protein